MLKSSQSTSCNHLLWARQRRAALSLFEVILAIAILGTAYAALAQLFSTGRVASVQASREVEALIKAESLMAQIEAGLVAQEAVSETQWVDRLTNAPEEGWYWQVDLYETGLETMVRLVVTVQHKNSHQAQTAKVQLARLLVDQTALIPEDASLTEAE